MSSNPGARAPIDPTDPIFQYLTSRPIPFRTEISPVDVDGALVQLEDAALLATRDVAGKRWVPGLAIVVVGHRGAGKREVLLCKGYGVKHIDGTAPVGPDTLFPCASVSKPVSTTLLTAAGVPQRPGGWDAPIQLAGGRRDLTLVKPPSPPTTLRQWLSHRSGLPDHAGDLIEDLNPSIAQDTLFNCILKHQTGIKPGEYEYTNMGFTMGCLGAAHVVAPGRGWDDFAETWMKKLGMSRSTYRFTPASDASNTDRVFPHQGQPAPPDLLSRESIGWTWRVVERDRERNPTLQAPAGGLLSSAADLGQFLLAHLNGGFSDFPPRDPPASDTKDRPYSLGWNVTNYSDDEAFKDALNAVSFNHSGAFVLGAGTCLRIDPDAGFGIAVLSNGEPTGVSEALAALFFKYLYAQPLPAQSDHAQLLAICRVLMLNDLHRRMIDNDERYEGKTVPIPSGIPRGLVFEGHSDYYASRVAIERRSDADLVLRIGNGSRGFPLWEIPLHCHDAATSTFVYATRGENAVGLSAIRLVWSNDVVVRIIDDWLNGSGPGLGEIASQDIKGRALD